MHVVSWRFKFCVWALCHVPPPLDAMSEWFAIDKTTMNSEWDDNMEYDLQEIDRLVANANASKCQVCGPVYCFASIIVWTTNKILNIYQISDRFICFILTLTVKQSAKTLSFSRL